ncbi:MAG: zeta toxin family protein [Anaerolineales bacterium]|nr:zeta toxin family protein [Anaerolineales bacterium]
MAKGKIIFLNGASNSGKAAIARQLQEILEEPYLYFSIDSFLHVLPEKYMSTADSEPSIENEKVLSEIMPGIMSAIHQSICMFASRGHNLIVDHVLQNQDWLIECIQLLENYPVLFVGVHCRVKELDRRERQRNMVQGLARQQFEIVHAHGIYDLEIDSADYDPLECAEQVKEALEKGLSGNAFSRLKQDLV